MNKNKLIKMQRANTTKGSTGERRLKWDEVFIFTQPHLQWIKDTIV